MQQAVLSKNHLKHLRAAAEISAADATQLITFRSSRRWAEAKRLIDTSGCSPLPILFAVVDRGPKVFFRALLREIVLAPRSSDSRSRELLLFRPPTTEKENLSEGVKTLYVISGCRKLDNPIPYATLRKQADDTPVSDDFRYSYALVTIDDAIALPMNHVASDITTPPVRIDAVVSRIVRDTALTRNLKAKHDDRCQLCEKRLEFPEGRSYSEAHHLQPLGRPHNGPDTAANIIVLCPNCHALCDHGAVNLVRSVLRTVEGHEIGDDFLEYHNQIQHRFAG